MASSAANAQGKSMAIWFPLKEAASPQPSVELHFNLWRMGHSSQKLDKAQAPDLLDIGIMVTAPSGLNSVSIYLPIAISTSEIKDLGHLLFDDRLATGIFNEELDATNGPQVIILKKASGATHCRVVKFVNTHGQIPESDLEVREEFEGTTLTITSTALDAGIYGARPDEKVYFRLRITIPKNGSFFSAAIPDDKWLTSGVDVTEYLDFRLNQARNLNPGISRRLTNAKSVRIARLDFLLVVGVAVDVVVGHPEFHKCRLLETDLWKSYVDEAHLQKGMVIYHWREVPPRSGQVVDFNAFVKLRLRLSGWRIIRQYLLIAFVFGIIVGLFSNTLYDAAKWGVGQGVAGIWGTKESVAPSSLLGSEAPAAKALEPATPVTNGAKALQGGAGHAPTVNGGKLGSPPNGNGGTDTSGKVTR